LHKWWYRLLTFQFAENFNSLDTDIAVPVMKDIGQCRNSCIAYQLDMHCAGAMRNLVNIKNILLLIIQLN
jgi:hypothetical protein